MRRQVQITGGALPDHGADRPEQEKSGEK